MFVSSGLVYSAVGGADWIHKLSFGRLLAADCSAQWTTTEGGLLGVQPREGYSEYNRGRATGTTTEGGLLGVQPREGYWEYNRGRATRSTTEGGLLGVQPREGCRQRIGTATSALLR